MVVPMTPHDIDSGKADAVAWLVGRLRFEAVLTDLQRQYDATGRPATFATRTEASTEEPAEVFAAVPTAAA